MKFYSRCSIPAKSDVNAALDKFIHHISVPNELLTDGTLELTKSNWGKTCVKYSIIQNAMEPHTQKIHRTESKGGIIKCRARHSMKKMNTPVCL